jgi:hypothetical protein
MKRGAYESAPLPISWEKKDYVSGHLDASLVTDHPQFGGKLDLRTALALMRDDRFIEDGIGNIFAKTLILPIDKEQVLRTGTVAPEDSALIVDQIEIPMRNSLYKSQLMVLEMLLTNNWERPMYIATSVGESFYPLLGEYMQLEGMTSRIVPIKSRKDSRVNTDVMYDNVMNKFKWGNISDPNVYLDETCLRSCYSLRVMSSRLAQALVREGKKDKAKEILDLCLEKIPETSVPYEYASTLIADAYYEAGETETADDIMSKVAETCVKNMDWTLSLSVDKQKRVSTDLSIRQNYGILQNIWFSAKEHQSTLLPELEEYVQKYYQFVQQ